MPNPRVGQTVLLHTLVNDPTTATITITDIDQNPITLLPNQRLWIDYIYIALPNGVNG